MDIMLLKTKMHPTLDTKQSFNIGVHACRRDTKTYQKKYTIFPCNKMAVSDNRPFILIFAEEETALLYTTIPNRTNSKSVAAKHVSTRIAAK
jgi:hypothetical protein